MLLIRLIMFDMVKVFRKVLVEESMFVLDRIISVRMFLSNLGIYIYGYKIFLLMKIVSL